MHYRIHTDCGLKLKERSSLTMRIIGAAQELLPQHNGKVRQRVMSTLKERRIEVHSGQRVKRFLADSVQTTEGQDFKSDASFYATGAALAAWPARCGLGLAADGFLDVLPTLQTASHEFVFAAGDAASIAEPPALSLASMPCAPAKYWQRTSFATPLSANSKPSNHRGRLWH
jgi:selenide,water dikinase